MRVSESDRRWYALVSSLAVVVGLVVSAPTSQAKPPVCVTSPQLCAPTTYISVFPNEDTRTTEDTHLVAAPKQLFLRDYIEGNLVKTTFAFTHLRWRYWGDASATGHGLMRYCERYSRPLPGAHDSCRLSHVHLIADQFEPCPDLNLYSRVRVFGTRYIHVLRVADQACGQA
jgi:hypothetical protein